MSLRRFLVRLSCPWVFRGARSSAHQLRELARTEHGSYLSLQWAAQHTTSLKRQAMYLRHASDEARHAQLFWQSANEQEAPQGPLDADGEDLFIDLGEAKFLAFVHHAELRGLEQFEIYRDYFTRRERLPLAERLQGICRDEEHHAAYSWKLLVELSGSVKEAKKLLRKIQLWEAWRSWKRSGRFLSLGIYTLLIWFLFPILLPYAILVRSFSRRPSGWQKAKPHG